MMDISIMVIDLPAADQQFIGGRHSAGPISRGSPSLKMRYSACLRDWAGHASSPGGWSAPGKLEQIDRKQNEMQEEYGIKVGQDAVDAEQHIAHHRQETQRHDGAHAEAAEHRNSRGVPHDIDPPHGEGSFADPDPAQCTGRRRSAITAEKPGSMPRFALSGSCRGAAVTISARISRTAP
jgi:hypothetical protein